MSAELLPAEDLAAGERWQREVLADKRFSWEPAELETVRLAAEALDRAAEAQRIVDRDGVLVEGLHGPKANPAVAVLRDAEAAFLRFAKALQLHEVWAPERKR